jgi:hypothetical protein
VIDAVRHIIRLEHGFPARALGTSRQTAGERENRVGERGRSFDPETAVEACEHRRHPVQRVDLKLETRAGPRSRELRERRR